MEGNLEGTDEIKFPYSGQIEVEIYFKEYKDSCANDCRRFLHKGRNGSTPLIEKLKDKLNEEEDTLTIFLITWLFVITIPPAYIFYNN